MNNIISAGCIVWVCWLRYGLLIPVLAGSGARYAHMLPQPDGLSMDGAGRATQEHLPGCKWLKTSGTSFPAKAEGGGSESLKHLLEHILE